MASPPPRTHCITFAKLGICGECRELCRGRSDEPYQGRVGELSRRIRGRETQHRPAQVVRPPPVAESPSVSNAAQTGSSIWDGAARRKLVIGEIVCVHLEDNVLQESRLDPDALDLIGRVGGIQYSHHRTLRPGAARSAASRNSTVQDLGRPLTGWNPAAG
jgi:hypothetical protein